MAIKVILAGASGLIGGQVARLLSGVELHSISRRQVDNLPETVIQHVADNGEWSGIVAALKPDVAISCLGSTIKQAGSKEAFAAIDRDLIWGFARAAKNGGARHCIIVSSVGASAKSGNFYLSIKGAAEDGLRALGFDRVDILQPGLLRGDRVEQRTGEGIAMLVAPFTDALMHGSLRRYRSIDSAAVAAAIVKLTDSKTPGVFIHENDAMLALAG